MKFTKEEFILPTAFLWTNQVLLNDIYATKDLKLIFDSTRTFLEKADKLSTLENIKTSLDTQVGKLKNASTIAKSLMVPHQNLF